MRPWELQAENNAGQKEIRFAWVCRNKHFNTIERVELTDVMLLTGSYPSWIPSNNCEILAKIRPMGVLDKSGIELFEGDIVLLTCKFARYQGDDEPEIVIKKMVVEVDSGCFWLRGDGLHENCHFHYNDDDREVIGNIYENPELLEAKCAKHQNGT